MKKSNKKKINNDTPSLATINELIENYQNGQYFKAENLARALIKDFPKHQFAWKILGALLKNTGRVSESLICTKKAVKLSPQDAAAHLNLGIILKEVGKLEQAEASYRQAIFLKPNYAEAFNNLGNIFDDLGQLDDAEKYYNKAVKINPNFAEAYNNLGVTLKEIGKLEAAEARFKKAIALKPNYAEAYNNLGITLEKKGRLSDAEASFRQAIVLKSNYSDAHNNLGNLLRINRNFKEATFHFDRLNNDLSVALSLECLYNDKNYEEFNNRLNFLSKNDNMNLRIAAISSFASHQMKKIDPYPFCKNPLDFVTINNISDYDFNSKILLDEIIKETDGYQLKWEARTTKFGFQGPSDIFENPSKSISLFLKLLQKEINNYYDKYKSETNFFIKFWPKKYKLAGWYNRLIKNGHHKSHIHQTGWLSGVFYLKTVSQPNNDEGAIEFGLHGYDLAIIDKNYPRKLHKPKKGDIVLFPSSLFHRTIPFTTDSERSTIAFDLKPI